jgi:hypothetical protein
VNTIVTGVPAAPRGTRLALWGLAVGVAGLVIQWIADPPKFNPFPPGIIFIVVSGVLVILTVRRWWAPVFAVLAALWIDLGGLAAGKMIPNFSAGVGTASGTAVMAVGLAFAAVAGTVATFAAWQSRTR